MLRHLEDLDLYEQAPDTRIVQFGKERHSLPFPYVYFKREGGTIYVAFGKKPVKSPGDFLYWPCLPNIYEGLNVCQHINPVDPDIEAINNFWHTAFGLLSFHTNECQLVFKHIGGLKKWKKLTPTKMLKVNYPKALQAQQLGKGHPLRFEKHSWFWGWC